MRESQEFISGSQVAKDNRKTKRWINCVLKKTLEIKRAGVSKSRKTSRKQRMTLGVIAEDREQRRELVAASMAEDLT